MSIEAVELFHGPGGWAEGLKLVAPGARKVGLELDAAAVATARAAGHDVDCVNVAHESPEVYAARGVIASPPCPGFSAAGLGLGRQDLPRLLELVARWSQEIPQDGWADERSALTLEVVRWLAALEPEWVALEQVKEVQPVWDAIGEQLKARGYSVWTGLVYAERYGVPQTRVRAVLIASRVRTVGEPRATHQRYWPPGHKKRDMPSFEEAMLPRWVSMAQALGWGMTERPYPTVACSSTTGGPDKEKVGGSAARAILYDEQREGRWAMVANAQSNAAVRDMDEPAPTIKGGKDFNERMFVMVDTGNTRGGERPEGRERDGDEPAVAITTRADQLEIRPRAYNPRDQRDTRSGDVKYAKHRDVEDPAPTISGASVNDSWVFDRPATTVQGDPRVWPPGHKINADDLEHGRRGGDRAGSNAIRVSVQEAAVLQSFRPDYPWQGTKTKQFQQVGNAVPPLMAAAILGEVLGVSVQ